MAKHQLTYWPIKAKNLASGIALELGGFEWEVGAGPGSKGTGDLWAEWLEMKPNTVWLYLPNMTVPGGRTIGSELAIMQYIGRKNPKMAGQSDDDFNASQELLHQAEELYQKLAKNMPTIMAKEKDPGDFWTNADKNTHSAGQGLPVYLEQFEKYMDTCGAGKDKYTATGTTVGECKLFATLHCVKLCDPATPFGSNLTAFYNRFNDDAKVKSVLNDKYGQTAQYFLSVEQAKA